MKNKSEKSFDAVKIMRDIRERLSREYLRNLEKEKEDLKKIHSVLPRKTKRKELA
ncbi:MAG: hypothetical protein GWP06_05010 [Actinobacteria bacterium]|nr:hypothetical protein [Actinomycetota bacterium]